MAHGSDLLEKVLIDDSEEIVNIKKTAIKPEEFVPKKSKKSELILCQKQKLAIVGTAETMPMTPFGDPDFEIWAVSVCTTYPAFKRADLLFELHNPSYWDTPNIVERLNKYEGPTYMLEHYKKIPRSVKFPLDVVLKYRRYHTTSITYMLALAYHSFITTGNPKHVAIFGVHMAAREEYTEQRPCCEFWLGMLEAAGVDLFMAPGGSVLASNGLYGYEGYHPIIPMLRERITGLQAGQNQCQSELERWKIQLAKNEGAISEAEYWMRQAQLGNIQKGK